MISSRHYCEIRDFLDGVPVIDTHEHQVGRTEPLSDVINFLLGYYLHSDMISAAYGGEEEAAVKLTDVGLPFDKRYAIFEKLYEKTCHTAYSRGLREGLKACWGIEGLDKKTVLEFKEKTGKRDTAFFESLMGKYGIKCMISDLVNVSEFIDLINGKMGGYSQHCRFAFTLPVFHKLLCYRDISNLVELTGAQVASLDDYEELFRRVLEKAVAFGSVCLKDNSAYRRTLDYGFHGREEAEKVFAELLAHRDREFSFKEIRPLDDWLFHSFMRKAAEYRMPVQLHTGHLAGNYYDVREANADRLIPTLQAHRGTKFGLFHGNWPYMDEYLYIGKSFPNAYLDLCWVQIIDPLYSVELMKRALVTMPHRKLLAYGGDTTNIECAVGYLIITRDNIAQALADSMDSKWIGMDDARQIAADWLYNNPNEFFGLGFEAFKA